MDVEGAHLRTLYNVVILSAMYLNVHLRKDGKPIIFRDMTENKKIKNMEEKKIQHYDCFFDKKKSNLKPFDIQKAREGKPVCTRDGRKARIICFDRDCDTPIVALVADPLGESVHYYLSNGKVDFDKQNDNDLMMLPEKKEGWINVYKGGKLDADYLYPSKEDAVENIFPPMKDKYIDTIKLTWEEE